MALALYAGDGPEPTEEEARFFGLTVEQAKAPPAEVWPDSILPLRVFSSMSTQWRTGAVGATGLDYQALESVFRFVGAPRSEWSDLFDDVQTMEGVALQWMRQEAAKDKT